LLHPLFYRILGTACHFSLTSVRTIGSTGGACRTVFGEDPCKFIRVLALAILELFIHLSIKLIVGQLVDAPLQMLLLSLLVSERL
jgi:hypothetical protein